MEVLDHAEELFRKKGYKNTSMADIGKMSGLKKGSLYHYFSGKEEIAIAVMERIRILFQDNILNHADQKDKTEKERLQNIVQELEKYFSDKKSCLAIIIGMEISVLSGEVEKIVNAIFSDWCEAFHKLLLSKYGDTSEQLAIDSILKIEGAVLWLKIKDDINPLKRACQEVVNLLD